MFAKHIVSKLEHEQVAEFMDQLKQSVLAAIDYGQILEITTEQETKRVEEDGIDEFYTVNFMFSIGVQGYRLHAVSLDRESRVHQHEYDRGVGAKSSEGAADAR